MKKQVRQKSAKRFDDLIFKDTKTEGQVASRPQDFRTAMECHEVGGNESGDKGTMTKMMMRLPRSLALEFQQTYLQLAALHLQKHGKKLFVQDCHIEMMRDWLNKQKMKLGK